MCEFLIFFSTTYLIFILSNFDFDFSVVVNNEIEENNSIENNEIEENNSIENNEIEDSLTDDFLIDLFSCFASFVLDIL